MTILSTSILGTHARKGGRSDHSVLACGAGYAEYQTDNPYNLYVNNVLLHELNIRIFYNYPL